MESLKIACFSRVTHAHGIRGGMERHLHLLADGLAALGHTVTVFTTGHPDGTSALREHGVAYRFLPTPPAKYRPSWWRASRHALQESTFDVVWGEGWAAEGIARIPRNQRPPLVSILHGTARGEMLTRLRQWRSPRMLALAGLMGWRHLTWRKHLTAATSLIAVSQQVAQDAAAVPGVDPQKIITIPNGIDLSRFDPDPAAAAAVRRQLDIPAAAPLLLSLNRLEREKGTHQLIDALPALPGQTHLLILGSGRELGPLTLQAERSPAAQRIHFAGFVDNQHIPAYLQAADIFCLPTLRDEGLPISLLEALASGLPVVASHVGGIAAAVTHEQEGLLVPMGDGAALRTALTRLLAEPEQRRALGEAARRAARENYSQARMVLRTAEVLLQAARERHPA